MEWNFTFVFNSILLGVGLAMDAFSVSMANGIRESKMSAAKMCGIAGIFAIFQGLMPLIGWFCVHTIAVYFTAFQSWIPWIALGLLGYIGGKMLYDSLSGKEAEEEAPRLGVAALLVQGIATSIDALSVGFTIAEYNVWDALVAVALIAAVTFVICFSGLFIGKKFGSGLACKATILGGSILVIIGLVIFIRGLLGI